MQGTASGRKLAARYYCSTRRKDHGCDQPLIAVEAVEEQLLEFVSGFKPNEAKRERILTRLAAEPGSAGDEAKRQRAELEARLVRIRDLYELGDLFRPDYLGAREAIQAELAALRPDPLPDLSLAERVLTDFGLFWSTRTIPRCAGPCCSRSSTVSGSTTVRWWRRGQKGRSRPSSLLRDGCVKSGSDGTRTRDLRRDSRGVAGCR